MLFVIKKDSFYKQNIVGYSLNELCTNSINKPPLKKAVYL